MFSLLQCSPKLLGNPVGNWSDAALLGQLIGVDESSQQYRGSLQPFFTGSEPHEKCAVARELVKRWLGEELKSLTVFEQPSAVADFLKIHFAGREYESFVVLFLDTHNRLLALDEMFRGTLTQTSVYPREVVKAALFHNAASVMFSHNHPTGQTDPSRADEHLTQTLKQALALVDVRVLDHPRWPPLTAPLMATQTAPPAVGIILQAA
jgi:DNA repair protein RadC